MLVRAGIGFVFPRPIACPVRHKSLSRKHLPFAPIQWKSSSQGGCPPRPSQNRTSGCRDRSVARRAVGDGLSVSAFPRYVPDLEPPSTQSPFARPVGYPLARQVSNLLDGVSFAWRTVRFVRLALGLRPVRGAPSGQSSSMGVGSQTRSIAFGVPVPPMIRIDGQDTRATGRAANWVRFARFALGSRRFAGSLNCKV